MKSFIHRAVLNAPAMNTLMVAVLIVGAVSLYNLRREVFPEFELEIILVTVPYPGASPEEVEEGICQKIEEAVRSIAGIKKQTAVAKEGSGSLVLELETNVDPQKILNEVRSEVDRIPSFPLLAEDPEVKQITLRTEAISIAVVAETKGEVDEVRLREIGERVREDLIRLPSVSQATIMNAKEYQIDVEIPEDTLRKHGLSLQQVAQIIRRENLELPGGTIKTTSQEILIKGKNKALVGEKIATIPVVTQPGGVVLTVADLGKVRDEFADSEKFTRVDGKPALVITVERTSEEDLLVISDEVRQFIKTRELPPGYTFEYWADRSIEVRDRMNLLAKNGFQGLILVLLILAIFLNLRLAWWVALGIPISILGACAVLYFAGHTLNMLTMFAFLMALGIVVDDAIVIGENIYTHRQRGVSYLRAAVDGTMEVLPSVTASVCTTIIAFMPLLFVTGIMGKFIAVLPIAMIAMLVISLLESTFILPCHLGHGPKTKPQPESNGHVDPHGELAEGSSQGLLGWSYRVQQRWPAPLRWTVGAILVGVAFVLDQLWYPFSKVGKLFAWLNVAADNILKFVSERLYEPLLNMSLRNPAIALSIGLVVLLLTVSLVRSGAVPFNLFPKLDNNTIQASITFPDGTPATVTDAATQRIESVIREMHREYNSQGKPILRLTRRSVGQLARQGGPLNAAGGSTGSHLGLVTAELIDTSSRSIKSQQIISEWRQRVGDYPGVESMKFEAQRIGPGGTPIEFKLLARTQDVAALEQAVEECKAKLATFPGVFDITDDAQPGKWEFQLRVKEKARAMGIPLVSLAETVRASYYGEEVMRLQRGRHEVKLMVRYPRAQRRSLADLYEIRVRGEDGLERPLVELADIQVRRGYSEINRVNQLRSITVSADVDEAKANSSQIVRTLQSEFMPELAQRYPNVYVRWEGQAEQTRESVQSLFVGLIIALLGMFVLLTLEFRSYSQPLMILAIIPFGAVGAVLGHALLGYPLTLFSLFGLVALTGVVVNDSIVLIDFINHRVRDNVPLEEALIDAGKRRLRPILLTSLTTIGGLFPLLLETSFQAQILIPMAVSLCFGLMLTTALILLLVPTFYLVYARITGVSSQDDEEEDWPSESSPTPERTEREPEADKHRMRPANVVV